MPPAAAAATAPLSPQSLGQSFTTGMTTGTPAAAGAQALSAGALHAATEPLPPPAPPPTTPTVTTPTVATATTAGIPHIPDSAPTPSPAPIAPPTTDNASAMTPIAPMVANGPPASPAPPAAAPAGPLPAYGADLRPPVTTPPATPPTPTGPISGAAVTPSSPAAGGSLMSPVVNKSTAPATTQAQPSNPTPPLASATAAATTGAAAGDTSRRAAEQQRLRRILDTVARQEPGLSWAAGLRDNGQTTLLVTDLASGWIPPHIRLPAHITLLEPAPRRRHATVTDLLGTTTVAAAHHPHGYLSQPDPDTPALTGDRTARIAPTIDELGPTLVETVRRHDTLPRIAQAVVVAATRNYGVPDNETDLLHHKTTEIHQAVLTTYPNHDIATVARGPSRSRASAASTSSTATATPATVATTRSATMRAASRREEEPGNRLRPLMSRSPSPPANRPTDPRNRPEPGPTTARAPARPAGSHRKPAWPCPGRVARRRARAGRSTPRCPRG